MRSLLKIDTKGEEINVIFLRPFSDEEYEEFAAPMRIESFHRTNMRMRSIVLKNGKELESFLVATKYKRSAYEEEDSLLLIEANRLLLNFLSSFTTFIDHCSKQYSIHLTKLKKDFQKRDSYYFDEYFEYRFFKQMRNIISHIAFPLTKIRSNKEGFHILLDKKELLKFDWKRVVNADLETLEETVDITPMISSLCRQVESLSYDVMYDYKEKIIEAIYAYNKVYKEVQGSFGFTEYGSLEEFITADSPKINPISIAEIKKAIQDLNTHPDINIKLVSKEPADSIE
ncbi:hypothetical protein SFC66_04555 [Terribacillus saccharophilus]|uniref:hypothetical protein n=1 Tax=Terribacillus saccharophilus TaxID=361277 RepID=UPI0039823EBC